MTNASKVCGSTPPSVIAMDGSLPGRSIGNSGASSTGLPLNGADASDDATEDLPTVAEEDAAQVFVLDEKGMFIDIHVHGLKQ